MPVLRHALLRLNSPHSEAAKNAMKTTKFIVEVNREGTLKTEYVQRIELGREGSLRMSGMRLVSGTDSDSQNWVG